MGLCGIAEEEYEAIDGSGILRVSRRSIGYRWRLHRERGMRLGNRTGTYSNWRNKSASREMSSSNCTSLTPRFSSRYVKTP